MAKVSVIVPIYGVEDDLEAALDSILDQTMEDLEIILINDGSKDKCPQIIDAYAKKDNRIKAIHKENGGYGQTMNIGLSYATGEYIAIMEPDDYIDKNMYQDLYNIAKKFDSDVVKSCFNRIQITNTKHIRKEQWSDEIPEDRSFTIFEYPYFLYYHPSVWTCLYKREFLSRHNIKFIEAPGAGWTDNPFQVQTMCLAKKINYTSKAYYNWQFPFAQDSDALRDYTIPFIRSDEIHEWLDQQNIKDKNILEQLYRRELSYIKFALNIRKINNLQDCYSRVQNMCKRMDKSIILNSDYITKTEKNTYIQCLKNPAKYRFKQRLKEIRRNLISIRFNQDGILISLMGKNIINTKK